jgi:hypothetical protein
VDRCHRFSGQTAAPYRRMRALVNYSKTGDPHYEPDPLDVSLKSRLFFHYNGTAWPMSGHTSCCFSERKITHE